MTDELRRLLEDLAGRLERIERQLGLDVPSATPPGEPERSDAASPPPPPSAAAPEPSEPATPPTEPEPAAAELLPEGEQEKPGEPPTPSEPAVSHPYDVFPQVPAQPAPASRETAAATRPTGWRLSKRPSRRPADDRSLELKIGQSWLGWAGAIVIVIGAGLLVKYGYDSGWWGRLAPLTKALVVAGFGTLLLAGGELALRSIGRVASSGLFAAGLGTLYLDAFATFRFFDLVGVEGAFVIMAVVALGGFALTLRTRFRVIGVLSLIGGYGTPILLEGSGGHVIEVGLFLSALLTIGLGLSAMRSRTFRPLRLVALVAHGLVGVWWVRDAANAQWFTGLTFISIWWALAVSESVLAALRRQSALGNVFATLLATAWFVTMGCWILDGSRPIGVNWLGIYTAMIGLTSAAGAAMLMTNLDELRNPRRATSFLAIAMWAMFAVLVAVAISLHFEGYGRAVGWLAVALAAIEISRRLDLWSVEIFGLVVGGLGFIRVVAFDWWVDPALMRATLTTFGAMNVTPWTILALGTIATLLVAGQRVRLRHVVLPVGLTAVAVVTWLGVWMVDADGVAITAGWLAAAAALVVMHAAGRRTAYLQLGLMTLALAALRWLLADAISGRFDPAWSAGQTQPFLNGQAAVALCIAVVGWWGGRVLRRHATGGPDVAQSGRHVVEWTLLGVTVLVLVALSFEVDHLLSLRQRGDAILGFSLDRSRQFVLTTMWAMGAAILGVLARGVEPARTSQQPPRAGLLSSAAWGILAVCAIKWIVLDTMPTLLRGVALADPMAIVNLRLSSGVMIAIAAMVLLRTDPAAATRREAMGGIVAVAVSGILLWGFSFEIERVITRLETGGSVAWPWPPLQVRTLCFTALWAFGGTLMAVVSRWRGGVTLLLAGWLVLVAAVLYWLGADTLAWRLTAGVAHATIGINLQAGVGVALIICLLISRVQLRQDTGPLAPASPTDMRLRTIAIGLVALLGLWIGSLEIDRFFDPGRMTAATAMAKQTALTIYWTVYAIGLIAVGMVRGIKACRFAGLALYAVALAKIVLIDMAGARQIFRVLSFIGVGVLGLITSVVYSKLDDRLRS